MSVPVTILKACVEGFCLYTGVDVLCHLPCSLVIAPLGLVRGMSHHFWVIFGTLVTTAMDFSRYSVSGAAGLFGDITTGHQGVSVPGTACC